MSQRGQIFQNKPTLTALLDLGGERVKVLGLFVVAIENSSPLRNTRLKRFSIQSSILLMFEVLRSSDGKVLTFRRTLKSKITAVSYAKKKQELCMPLSCLTIHLGAP